MKYSLIVPVAADKAKYENEMPFAFTTGKSGLMHCIDAVTGLELAKFDAIYFTILKKHDDRFNLVELFSLQFKRLGLENAKVVVLDEPTSSQPETVFRTLEQENVQGGIFVKDADCYFKCDVNGLNAVAVYPLEDLDWVNPKDKSYVAADDSGFVTNIIEKKVIGHLFSAGGYSFENADDFRSAFKALDCRKGLYISHIIYSLLLEGSIFRPIQVVDYVDYNFGR